MKKAILCMTLLCGIAAHALAGDSTGYHFYRAYNKALVEYYVYNRFDSFKVYNEQAFKILPGALYPERYESAGIYAQEHDYKKALSLFRRSIKDGMDARFVSSELEGDSAHYKGFLQSAEYTLLKKEKDSIYNVFKSNLDISFIQEIFWDIGADQVFRNGSLRGEAVRDCFIKLGNAMDSVNYASLKNYIKDNGFPDFNRLDYVTKNTFNVIMNHYIPSGLDSINGNFFLNLFNQKLMEGKVPNTFMTPALDYKSLGASNGQMYGTYGYLDSGKYYHYNPFSNADSIDTWRNNRCLPPLYVEYKKSNGKIVLPEGYKYK